MKNKLRMLLTSLYVNIWVRRSRTSMVVWARKRVRKHYPLGVVAVRSDGEEVPCELRFLYVDRGPCGHPVFNWGVIPPANSGLFERVTVKWLPDHTSLSYPRNSSVFVPGVSIEITSEH